MAVPVPRATMRYVTGGPGGVRLRPVPVDPRAVRCAVPREGSAAPDGRVAVGPSGAGSGGGARTGTAGQVPGSATAGPSAGDFAPLRPAGRSTPAPTMSPKASTVTSPKETTRLVASATAPSADGAIRPEV